MNIEQMLKELKRSKLYERSTNDMNCTDVDRQTCNVEKMRL